MNIETRPLPTGGPSPAGSRRGKISTPKAIAEATQPSRLCPISAKIGHQLSREIDAYAEAHGITRSHAASEYLDIASEVLREREGIPGGLERLGAAVDILGPPAFGVLRLLAHWASQGGGLKVNEDELVAEVRGVGADEWEQAIADAERGLRELARTGHPKADG